MRICLRFRSSIPTVRSVSAKASIGALGEVRNLTVVSSTETNVTWGDWENGDTRFYLETLTGSPARLQKISLLQPGVYAIMASLFYSAAFPASRHVIFLDDYVQDPLISVKAVHFGTTAADSFQYGDTLQVVRGFPVFTSDVVTALVARVFIKANQTSGVDRDLTDGLLEIYYLGGLSVETEEP